MTVEKGDILLYRFARHSGQISLWLRRALPALWQAGGIPLPERGQATFWKTKMILLKKPVGMLRRAQHERKNSNNFYRSSVRPEALEG